jgi:tRNA G18 (ribose-2'-O)-methylase SpoU
MHNTVDLVGDGIENPWNAKTMIHIAQMFGSTCLFRDRKDVARSLATIAKCDEQVKLISCDEVANRYSPIFALENLDEAHDIYGFKPPFGPRNALIVGNEKFGIARDMKEIANHVLQIPMPGPTLNTLNVAAAAGVALYYLYLGTGNKLQVRNNPQRRRPEILFTGVADHVELGSAIRSAGAFGWNRLFLEDREGVWFGCDRVKRSEGRAAARRARNSIRLVPVQKTSHFMFKEVLIVSSKQGLLLDKTKLASGPQQLLVIPDESQIDVSREDWGRLGTDVSFAQIRLPGAEYTYHYRLFASIALAEAARQIGQRPVAQRGRAARQGLIYDSTLAVLFDQLGEEVFLEDLEIY